MVLGAYFAVVVLPTTILMGYWLVVGGFDFQHGRFHFEFGVPTTIWFLDKLLLGTFFSPTTTLALIWLVVGLVWLVLTFVFGLFSFRFLG